METKTDKFFIPKETPQGLTLTGARVAGELASIAISNIRKNRKQPNPYNINFDASNADFAPYKTDLGNYINDQVVFQSVTYQDNQGNTITTSEITFQSILIDLTFPRNIVKTEIQGRNGTVKEYIGEGDASITFRGVICGKNGQYPLDAVNAMKKAIQSPVAIPVACKYLNDLDITSIVFEDRILGQEEGGYSYQTFSLNAISDISQELHISGL